MISGDIAQGLNDLTNALPIKENLEAGKEENWEKLTILNDEDQLMGCSIAVPKNAGTEAPVKLNGEKCGLFYGHAYSLLDVISLKTRSDKQEFHLLRIRNPWGHGEWILDWSDTPVDSDPDYQKLKKYQSDLNEYYKQKQ